MVGMRLAVSYAKAAIFIIDRGFYSFSSDLRFQIY